MGGGGGGVGSDCSHCRPTSLQSKFNFWTAVRPHCCGGGESNSSHCRHELGLQWLQSDPPAVQVHVWSNCSQTPLPSPTTVRPDCSPSSCLKWLQSDPSLQISTFLIFNIRIYRTYPLLRCVWSGLWSVKSAGCLVFGGDGVGRGLEVLPWMTPWYWCWVGSVLPW